MYIIMSDTFIKIDLNLELFWTNNNPIIEWGWVGSWLSIIQIEEEGVIGRGG